MKTYLYPAYFRHVESGGYSVDFPDLPGCISVGNTLEEALAMAREALSLHIYGMIEDGDPIPAASDPTALPTEKGAFISPVEGRPDMVRDEIRNRAVKRRSPFHPGSMRKRSRRGSTSRKFCRTLSRSE